MSAIECKILLCSQKAAGASEASAMLVDDLKRDERLAEDIINVQERYIKTITPLLSKLTENG